MNRLIFLLLSALLLCCAPAQADGNTLNVMTYNVRHGRGLDNKIDYGRIADVIRKAGVDVVAVQEVDSFTNRTGGRYTLGELAAEALMRPVFAPAILLGEGKYGVGVLSKEKPLGSRSVALPGREEDRVLLIVEFPRYELASTHLSLTPEDALASVPLIAAEARKSNKPFIVAGDWNSHPDSPVLKAFREAGFRIATSEKVPTFPADKPGEVIDYIAIYEPSADALVPVRSSVVKEPVASDHRPVAATFKFRSRPEEILVNGPYLQNPSPDGITVMFQASGPARSVVEYGLDTLSTLSVRELIGGQEVCHDIEHKIRLQGLQGGKKYYYRVKAQEILDNQSYSKTFGEEFTSPWYSFTLPSETTSDFTALIFNDLHQYAPAMDAMARLAAQTPHDFVIFNGDCLPEPANRADAIEAIGNLIRRFRGADIPAFYIRGNHEIRNAWSSGMSVLFDNPGGKTYGAFSWGDTRFVLLDCGEDKPDSTWVYYGLNDFTGLRHNQIGFLKEEMASRPFKKAARRVLIHHIPVWGNTDKYRPCTELWSPVLEKMPFDVDFAAHTHSLAVYPAGSSEGNPFPVVVGSGPEKPMMIVLEKKGREMKVRVIDERGVEKSVLKL